MRGSVWSALVAVVACASGCGRWDFDVTEPNGPDAAALDPNRVVAVSAGGDLTCILRASGAVWCWGNNNVGQLGDGTTISRFAPAPVAAVTDAVQVAAGSEKGGEHVCIRHRDGAPSCWGFNFKGALGTGAYLDSPVPIDVAGVDGALDVSAGGLHTCALRASGKVVCWGHNWEGQIGDRTVHNMRPRPTDVANLPAATRVIAGHRHSCAVASDGVYCWGVSMSPTAKRVSTATDVVMLDSGLASTCLLHATGVIECSGYNNSGQLGDGTTITRPTFASVANLPAVVELSAGLDNTCARTETGTAYCWGRNNSGQLAGGSLSDPALTPVEIPTISDFMTISMGSSHACGLRATGDVVCWGANTKGQLGADPALLQSSSMPVVVNGL